MYHRRDALGYTKLRARPGCQRPSAKLNRPHPSNDRPTTTATTHMHHTHPSAHRHGSAQTRWAGYSSVRHHTKRLDYVCLDTRTIGRLG